MSYEEIPPDAVSSSADVASPTFNFKCLDTVIALYDFPGTQPSHLPLDLGDTVYVLSKNDSGWWDGVLNKAGDVTRGWFPENYVRSVNYVQPVLNKLKSNKEIDSITAANTAANVLIPLFTSLLQKSLVDSAKDTSATNTRKNSVVSFALSETSIPSENKLRKSGTKTPPHQPSIASTISMPGSFSDGKLPPHQSSFASTISMPYSAGSVSHNSISQFNSPSENNSKLEFVPVRDAEAAVAELKKKHGKNVLWLPRMTDSGDLVYYCEYLNIYCDTLPLCPMIPTVDVDGGNVDIPSRAAIDDMSIISRTPNSDYFEAQQLDLSRSNSSLSKAYDPTKRESNASTLSQSSASSYHHFLQPFFITPGLFYKQFSDLSYWTELHEQFNYLLELTYKALKDSNKQLFTMHLSRLTKVISIVMSAAKLIQEDFIGTKYERAARRRLKHLSESFAQMYINGLLHLSVMHYSQTSAAADFFSLDIRGLNKSTSAPSTNQHSMSSRESGSTIVQGGSRRKSSAEADLVSVASSENAIMTYLQQIDNDVDAVRHNMNALVKMFLKLSKGKKVNVRDYDNSDVSEDEGEDRYNILPQVYPRFITNEFNGGNWCNPFFTGEHTYLNVSGDQLKNKYHLKVLIDQAAYDRARIHCDDITKFTKDALVYLEPDKQGTYYNEKLHNERNEQILRVMYKYLHNASALMDLLESLDFTVFCLIKRSSSEDSSEEPLESEKPPTNAMDSNLTFDYPIVLEFFQHKQQFHSLVSNIVLRAQSLCLEDPDAFTAMKEDDFVLYNRDAMKDPLEKTSMLLSSILMQQSKRNNDERLSFDQDDILRDLLFEGQNSCETLLSIIKILIEERESILNYGTRVMHDNFNVELLVIERNNTAAGSKSEEGGQYFSGKSKNDNTPWYLEGDEEFDLLLDVNRNIKGGTREALIAHLTHHDVYDSSFNTSFLTSFGTIMGIGELVLLLINRFNIEPPEGLSYEEYLSWRVQKQSRIRAKVLNVMKLVLENHWCDSYKNKTVMNRWLAFLQVPIVKTYPISKVVAEDIERILTGETLTSEPEAVPLSGKAPAPILKSFALRKMKLMDIDYIELARQLTVREFKLYCNISKLSCIHKVWGKKSGLSESIEDIANFIRASNQLTNFVAYMILRRDDPRKRVQVIRYFVQAAEKCRQYNNFSSMTAIISALYSSPIHRLKKTWVYVSKETMSRLQNMNKLMNSSRNFNEYRDMLKFIGSEPCVPFFGVYLSDLTFVYHGNPDHLLNRSRMINFAKRAKTVDIVMGIDRFKRIGYNFQSVPEIQNFIDLWFDKCPTIEEQYQLSLNLEPRETADRRVSAIHSSKPPTHVLGLR